MYNKGMEKIIVDIDNTLWDLAPVLYERIREVSPDLPPPAQWEAWDFWRSYIRPERIYDLLYTIHLEQEKFDPYEESAAFLASLKEAGFYIIVASHRRPEALGPTERWLQRNGLAYDSIHLSYDKTVLFDESWGIVDDSPVTLEKAKAAGIVRTGLVNPWNEGEDHPLFQSLPQIFSYLLTQL